MKSGWQKVKISELFKVGSSKRVLKSQWQNEGIPFYRGREITSLSTNGFVDNDLFITEKMFEDYATKYGVPKAGDIVITAIGTIGNAYLVKENDKFYFKDASVLWLKKTTNVSSKFVEWWLKSPLFFEQLDKGNGATVDTLTIQKLQSLEIDIPLPEEQKRIVAILDEAFENIAIAKANAEKNLQNARELFESYLNSIFFQHHKSWLEKTFNDVCIKITDGTHHSPKTQFKESGPERFPYITSKNIRNNFMDLSNVAYIERTIHEEIYARCQPSLGDVLLTKDGAGTGNVTLNSLDRPFSLLSSVCLIKTNPILLKPAFLCYYLQSHTGLSNIVGQMTGAAIKRIVLKDIKKATIPLPSLKEQENIVATLDSLLTETKNLSQFYTQKLAALDELKKSLLQKAFSGEL